LVFLRGFNEDSMDTLNLIGGGDISKEPFDDILKVCRNYSMTLSRKPRGDRSSITSPLMGFLKLKSTICCPI
jgi:hypothetical protein